MGVPNLRQRAFEEAPAEAPRPTAGVCMSSDLVAFLQERLDEDEQAARAAGLPLPDDDRDTPAADPLTLRTWQDPDGSWVIDNEDGLGGNGYIWGEQLAAHIARHDPARVL